MRRWFPALMNFRFTTDRFKASVRRYCPSIETKLVTFADKDSHQLFLEPEGETTEEYYVNGFEFDAVDAGKGAGQDSRS